MEMLKKKKLLFRMISVLLVIVIVFVGYNYYYKPKKVVEITLLWGRLAQLPESLNDFEYKVEGSSFTRSFRISFEATTEDIKQWINNSPGINDATIEKVNKNVEKYIIPPGGGACYAEVIVDYNNNKVKIYVSWS